MRKAAPILMLLSLALAAGCGRGREPRGPAGRSWLCMGTLATVTAGTGEAERLPAYLAAASNEIAGIEAELSIFKQDSEISRLNRAAGGAPVPVSPRTADILRLVLKYGEVSEGAFDPTLAPLVKLWGFSGGKKPERIPDAAEIGGLRGLVGYTALTVSNGMARLAAPGMSLDLGGIAKGYAVDACYGALAGMGASNFMTDLGGNIRCRGSPRTGRGGTSIRWRIGVRNPFDRMSLLGTISIPDGMAVATSGNYEKYVMIGGERYAHIIDPRTGRPVKGMAGVTALAASAVEADAMSTALFVLGMDGATNALARLPDCHALLVPDKQPIEIWTTAGFSNAFVPNPGFAGSVRVLK